MPTPEEEEAAQEAADAAKAKQTLPDDPAALRAELEKVRKEAANYRTKAKELEPLAQKAKELEEASKSDIDKATDKATAAEQRAQEAEARALRLEVAADKGLTPAQAKRLVGSTQEELEADADELLASFAPAGDESTPGRRPKERLRSGAVPDAPKADPSDPAELVKGIPRT